jgi:hypothetical protein
MVRVLTNINNRGLSALELDGVFIHFNKYGDIVPNEPITSFSSVKEVTVVSVLEVKGSLIGEVAIHSKKGYNIYKTDKTGLIKRICLRSDYWQGSLGIRSDKAIKVLYLFPVGYTEDIELRRVLG